MVLLGRTIVRSQRLPVQTTVVSGTVRLQFVMQVLTRGCKPTVCGEGGDHRGLEMGPLSSPVVTSYKLSTGTIGPSLNVFTVLRLFTDRQTDRLNWSSEGSMYTKVLQLPNSSHEYCCCVF